jgi:hypothetical protein
MVEQMKSCRPLPALRSTAAWAALGMVLAGGAAVRAVDDEVVESIDKEEGDSGPNLLSLGEQFDQNIAVNQPGWGNFEVGDVREPGAAEPDMVAAAGRMADRRLGSISRTCELRPAQVRALRLAMESDIRRMSEAVGRERAKYEGRVVDLNQEAGQQLWNAVQQDAARVRERIKGLFESGSLFRKAIASVLDDTQAARLAGSRDRQQATVWKSLVITAMLELDDGLGLDQTQSDTIERLLLERTPPLNVENFSLENGQEHMQQTVFCAMLAEADQKRLKAAVSVRQWRVLSQYVNQGRAMRQHLENEGFLEKIDKPPR